MQVERVDHLGVAVADLEAAHRFFGEVLGIEKTHEETVEDQGVNTHFYPIGRTKIELLEPLSEDSPVARYLEDHGPGLHHVALEVPDVQEAIAWMQDQGVTMIDEEPRPGVEDSTIAFCHPSDTHGILLELVDLPPEHEVDVLGA